MKNYNSNSALDNEHSNASGDPSLTNNAPQAKATIGNDGGGVASMILGNLGLVGGLFLAYRKKSHFWGYVGYGALFGVIGSVVGTIADKTVLKK